MVAPYSGAMLAIVARSGRGRLASPGPNLLVVSQTAASRTRQAGLWVTAGISTGAVTWSILALMSLDFVFEQVPLAYGVFRALGGAYLVYLGVRMWLIKHRRWV